jgi:thiol:disulfide interchange protein DsbA
MKSPLILIAVVAMALVACGGSPPAPASTPAPAVQSLPAAAASDAMPASPAITKTTNSESTRLDTASGREEAALERVAQLPAAGSLPAGKWVAGTHYRPLVPAQPTDAAPGKVEVVEMFWYACPHCYALDPYLESWRKNKPAYVEFRRVPITWGEVHRAHARLFYTLEALGKEEALHGDVFAEMHDRKNYMFMQGDERETLSAEVAFVKARGISEADFLGAYNSFSVQTNLQKADDLAHRYRVEGVPLVIINGKYVTDVTMAGSQSNLISIINDLAASEKRR